MGACAVERCCARDVHSKLPSLVRGSVRYLVCVCVNNKDEDDGNTVYLGSACPFWPCRRRPPPWSTLYIGHPPPLYVLLLPPPNIPLVILIHFAVSLLSTHTRTSNFTTANRLNSNCNNNNNN